MSFRDSVVQVDTDEIKNNEKNPDKSEENSDDRYSKAKRFYYLFLKLFYEDGKKFCFSKLSASDFGMEWVRKVHIYYIFVTRVYFFLNHYKINDIQL
jgi:hypothetical protein